MTDDVVMRLARADELPAIGRLTADVYVAEGFVGADNPYLLVLLDAAGRAANAQVWVAELAGEIVGTVTFCPPGSSYRQAASDSEGEFRMLAVADSARGRGIGRRLVEQCFALCRAHGLDGLVLVSQDDMRAAHRVYAASGSCATHRSTGRPIPASSCGASVRRSRLRREGLAVDTLHGRARSTTRPISARPHPRFLSWWLRLRHWTAQARPERPYS